MATATKNQTVKDAQNASVRVEIFDQAYNLRGSDPEYILKLAEYVHQYHRYRAPGRAGRPEHCR
jgi:cell division protein ZapA (FtsZ GTPase activity inhibitor)